MNNSRDFVIENGVLVRYKGSSDEVIVPAGVTEIGNSAFYDCSNLKSVDIPAGVTKIGDRAFEYCSNLESIDIPAGVTEIGNSAFSYCSNLKSVDIPAGVTKIGECAFSYCSNLKSVDIPAGVTKIGWCAFEDCSNLESIDIPAGVTEIGSCAFSHCSNLKSVDIPAGVTEIGSRAFSYCSNLKSVDIPAGVTKIGEDAFCCCSNLESIDIPAGVTKIGESAFSCCSNLKSVDIPAGETEIGREAFEDCSNLESIDIPAGVTEIGDWAFRGCSNLKRIVIPSSCPKLSLEIFGFGNENTIKELYIRCEDLLMSPTEFLERNNKGLSVGYTQFLRGYEITPRAIAMVILYQKGKSWENAIFENLSTIGIDSVVFALLDEILISETQKNVNTFVKFVNNYIVDINRDTLLETVDKLKERKPKILDALNKNYAFVEKCKSIEREIDNVLENLHPIEQYVKEKQKVTSVVTSLRKIIKKGIKYRNTENISSSEAVIFIVAEYASQLNKTIFYSKYEKGFEAFWFSEEADKVASELDIEELRTVLEELAYRDDGGKEGYIIPFGRYASGKQVSSLITKMNDWKSWGKYAATGRKNIMIARGSLMLNESREAMLAVDKVGGLGYYAGLRNLDEEIMRDTVLSEFGFDFDGKKEYDLGGNFVSISMSKELDLMIFDENAGKFVKSIPKKNADIELYDLAKTDFAEIKKNIKNVVKSRKARLFEQFLSGEARSSDKWKQSYINNPILRAIAQLVIWVQGDSTFVLKDITPIDSYGNRYEISEEEIRVAHPIEMEKTDIARWQKYFMENNLKQPFIQIWEPAISPEQVGFNRYKGIELSILKFANKQKHGIIVGNFSDYSEDIYLYLRDCSLETEMSVGRFIFGSTDDATFTLGEFSIDKHTRYSNHIITMLDTWAVKEKIIKDDVSIMEYLDSVTFAQITDFIMIASDNKCNNCLALLLDYKNKKYADYNPMDAFVLD